MEYHRRPEANSSGNCEGLVRAFRIMPGKILVISWSLPPEPTGSAVIIGNLAKQFSAEEMVLAGEKAYRRPPVSWRENWPRIVYIASSLPPTWRGARWWRRVQL